MAKNNEHSGEFVARVMAVQALYQNSQNKTSIREIINQYIDSGFRMETPEGEILQGVQTAKPKVTLFQKIMIDLDNRFSEVDAIVSSHIMETVKNAEGEEIQRVRKVDPLLKAIVYCGVSELLNDQDTDAALIIDDYLNATHAFYEKGEVSFVNGILDKASKVLRA